MGESPFQYFVKTHNNLKYSDRQVFANSIDPDMTKERSDQRLHVLSIHTHYLVSLLYGKITLFKF